MGSRVLTEGRGEVPKSSLGGCKTLQEVKVREGKGPECPDEA